MQLTRQVSDLERHLGAVRQEKRQVIEAKEHLTEKYNQLRKWAIQLESFRKSIVSMVQYSPSTPVNVQDLERSFSGAAGAMEPLDNQLLQSNPGSGPYPPPTTTSSTAAPSSNQHPAMDPLFPGETEALLDEAGRMGHRGGRMAPAHGEDGPVRPRSVPSHPPSSEAMMTPRSRARTGGDMEDPFSPETRTPMHQQVPTMPTRPGGTHSLVDLHLSRGTGEDGRPRPTSPSYPRRPASSSSIMPGAGRDHHLDRTGGSSYPGSGTTAVSGTRSLGTESRGEGEGGGWRRTDGDHPAPSSTSYSHGPRGPWDRETEDERRARLAREDVANPADLYRAIRDTLTPVDFERFATLIGMFNDNARSAAETIRDVERIVKDRGLVDRMRCMIYQALEEERLTEEGDDVRDRMGSTPGKFEGEEGVGGKEEGLKGYARKIMGAIY